MTLPWGWEIWDSGSVASLSPHFQLHPASISDYAPEERKGSFQVCTCSPLNCSFYRKSEKMVNGELGESVFAGEMGGIVNVDMRTD